MPKIDELYAFIAEDAGPDDEGVCAMLGPNGWMAMVAADWKRVESIKEIAQEICDRSGKPVRLCRFKVREEVELLEPDPAKGPS